MRIKTFFITSLLFLIMSVGLIAQSKVSENILKLDEAGTSPEASLQDISWLAGHWKGEAFGGITEEVWTPPLGGSMMCAFKLVVDNKVKFYELVAISEVESTLMLRLKHFHSDLRGWEEKDVTIDFPLVKAVPSKIYFDGFTIEKISDDEVNIFVLIGKKGEEEEVKFNYYRVIE